MKSIIFFILILVLISCNRGKNTNIEFGLNQTKVDTSNIDNNYILGHWTMCSTFGHGSMINYNVCPQILFSKAGTGVIIFSNKTETFYWTLNKRKLTILNVAKNSENMFLNKTYMTFLKKEKNFLSLEIFDKDNSFNLSKSLFEKK